MRSIMNGRADELEKLIERNPRAANGRKIIQDARELVEAAREAGVASRSYTIKPSFGGRLWIRSLKASKISK